MTQGAKKIADGQHKIEEGMNTFGVKLNEATAGTKKIADGDRIWLMDLPSGEMGLHHCKKV